MKNQKEIANFGGKVFLTTLLPEEITENIIPNTVHIFPINKQGKILFTENQRGIDIIGGHIEKGETVEEALFRESMEEACITLNTFSLVGAIMVDNTENPTAIQKGYPQFGYQFFYISTNYIEKQFLQTHESISRKYIDKDEINNIHHNWLRSHQVMLNQALMYYKQSNKPKI